MQLLSRAKEKQVSTPALLSEEKGKGLCQLASGKIEIGVHCLQEAILELNDSVDQAILKLLVFQTVWLRCSGLPA